jgi:hypothetical protein
MFMNFNRHVIKFLSAILLGVILSFLPLVGDFHVETAQVTALLIAIYSVFFATRTYHKELHVDGNAAQYSSINDFQSLTSEDVNHGSSRYSHFGINNGTAQIFPHLFKVLAVLLLPIFVKTLYVGCLSFDGLLIILLIAIPTVVLCVAISRLFVFFQFRWPLALGLLVLFFLCVVLPLFILRQVPHAYLFNVIWGWFPGPIYDEEVRFTWSLLLHRISVLLFSALLWLMPEHIKRWKLLLFTGVLLLISLFLWQSTGVFRTLDTIEANLGSFKESDNFRLVYDATGMTPFAVDYWLLWHEFHLTETRDLFEVESTGDLITSILYRDRWQKHTFTGAKNTSYVPVWNKLEQMHLDLGSGEYLLRHELVHVVAKPFGLPVLGASFSMGLTEGIAVANEDPRSKPSTLNELVAASGVIPSIDELLNIFTPWGFYGGRGGVNYTISGSFVCHLLRNGSIDDLKKTYRTGNMTKAYGDSIYDLYNNWANEIKSTSYDTLTYRSARAIFGRESIFESECPRRVSSFARKWDRTEMLFSRGELDAAAILARELMLDNPESPTVWLRWTFFELARGGGKDVIETYRSTWQSVPNIPDQLKLRYADALISLDLLAEAERVVLELRQNVALKENLNLRGFDDNDINFGEWATFINTIYSDGIASNELLQHMSSKMLAYYISIVDISKVDADFVVNLSEVAEASSLGYMPLYRLATFFASAKAIGFDISDDLLDEYFVRLNELEKSLIQIEQVKMLERFRALHSE